MNITTIGIWILLGMTGISFLYSCKADDRQDAIAAFTYTIDTSSIRTSYDVVTVHPDPMNIDSTRIDTIIRHDITKVAFKNASLNAAEFLWNFGDNSPESSSTDTTVYHDYVTKDSFQIQPNKKDTFVVKLSVNGLNGEDVTAQKVIIK